MEANRKQAEIIFETKTGDVTVHVSSKWARHKFPCQPDYITANCKGRCCEGSDRIMISLLPEEAERHEAQGFAVQDGFLQPNPSTGLCPHKLPNGLCRAHGTDMKPFGCIASPFTLNKSNTLVIRHRYSQLKCHGQGEAAYKTFRASLDLIFGEDESARICAVLDEEANTITASMPRDAFNKLEYLDGLKHGGNVADKIAPVWIVGDAANISELAPGEYDFIFSCPPYYDLEVYSDLDGELSALPNYEDFLLIYRQIVAECVAMLKEDRFACFVVGDIRDKDGFYRNFVSDTIAAFQDAGAKLYNEAILITAIGSLPIRVGRQFEAGRKLGKTHQNVLIFVKGDPRRATKACGPVDIGDLE